MQYFELMQKLNVISKPYGVQVLCEVKPYYLLSSFFDPKIKQIELWPVVQGW